MRSASKLMLLAAAIAAVAATLAACGGDDGETVSGAFELTAEAPASYAGLEGEADLTRADGETTVAISLTGLEPDTEYVSHLHFGGCAAPEAGGPHFKFDLDGSDEPPNEIHMTFESDADGAGEAEATAEREVPAGDAGSVVVHPASEMKMAALVHDEEHEHPDRIACAELEGASPKAGEAAEDADAMKREEGSMEHEHGDAMEHEGHGEAEHGEAMEHGDSTTIVVAAGEPVDGIAELEYSAGEQVEFTVESDAAEEIHVHGYDVSRDVPAGGSVSFSFPAEIEGIFEIELEELGVQIAELTVNP